MLKKSIYVGGASLLLLALLFGADAFSYVATGISRTREAVKNNVPIEFQLDRARQMIKNLDPEIARNMHKIAKEEVSLEELNKKKESLEGKLTKSEQDILRLNADVQRGDSTFVYAGKSYSGEQVRGDLENRFSRHKTMKELSENLAKTITIREQGLSAAQAKLREMQAARGQLEVEVANLAARLEMVKVAKTSSDVCCFDDSVLARARSLIQDIDTRIGVDEKILGSETVTSGEIELEDQSNRDLSAEISQYFHGEKDTAEKNTAIVQID